MTEGAYDAVAVDEPVTIETPPRRRRHPGLPAVGVFLAAVIAVSALAVFRPAEARGRLRPPPAVSIRTTSAVARSTDVAVPQVGRYEFDVEESVRSNRGGGATSTTSISGIEFTPIEGAEEGETRLLLTLDWDRTGALVLSYRADGVYVLSLAPPRPCIYDKPVLLYPVPLEAGATWRSERPCRTPPNYGLSFGVPNTEGTLDVRGDVAGATSMRVDDDRVAAIVVDWTTRSELKSDGAFGGYRLRSIEQRAWAIDPLSGVPLQVRTAFATGSGNSSTIRTMTARLRSRAVLAPLSPSLEMSTP